MIADLAAVHRGSGASSSAAAAEVRQDDVARWGPLQLRNRIGSGRFATVYLAWDPVLQRDVAVKLLGDTGRLRKSSRKHVCLRACGTRTSSLFMEWIRTTALSGCGWSSSTGSRSPECWLTRGVLGPREAALIGLDLCRARRGGSQAPASLHRDIKAQNVMREAGGRIVLMDFGAGEMRADRTPSGACHGHPGLSSPLSSSTAPSATIASDVYSVGVVAVSTW